MEVSIWSLERLNMSDLFFMVSMVRAESFLRTAMLTMASALLAFCASLQSR